MKREVKDDETANKLHFFNLKQLVIFAINSNELFNIWRQVLQQRKDALHANVYPTRIILCLGGLGNIRFFDLQPKIFQ